jgi:hypothetical protein
MLKFGKYFVIMKLIITEKKKVSNNIISKNIKKKPTG